MNDKNVLFERIEQFTMEVHQIVDAIPSRKITVNSILEQLARSSLSCSLNYSEAISAESRKDFIHKLRIVLKELRETTTCLRLLKHRGTKGSEDSLESVLTESDELGAIIYSSIRTAERSLKRPQ